MHRGRPAGTFARTWTARNLTARRKSQKLNARADSSAGRARPLQGRGRRFDPSSAYHLTQYVRRPSVFIEEVNDLHRHTQGLGMRRVLLIISEPESTKSKTSGCRSKGPRTTTPSG